ncbi:MAG: VOC family protein, partial [Candidatus Dormibacteraceae bacterium]
MRTTDDVFHLAIPTRNLDEAYEFYVAKLGCKLARRRDDRITLDFFGDQVVCHHSSEIAAEPKEYPRHFGVTFRELREFDNLLQLARARGLPFFR